VKGDRRDHGSGRSGKDGVCDMTKQTLPSSSRRYSSFFSSCGAMKCQRRYGVNGPYHWLERCCFKAAMMVCCRSHGGSRVYEAGSKSCQQRTCTNHERQSSNKRPQVALKSAGLALHRGLYQRVVMNDHLGGWSTQRTYVRKERWWEHVVFPEFTLSPFARSCWCGHGRPTCESLEKHNGEGSLMRGSELANEGSITCHTSPIR